MSHFHISWEDEKGNELGGLDTAPLSDFSSLIPAANVQDFPCLRYVDLWGDTAFNGLQIPQLITDLEQILALCKTGETRADIEAIIDMVRRASGEPHTYIKFYGD